MKSRGGADASQAGTSGGRGKWLPRDHHYPLAPAARPIGAGGCSGCVTSGAPSRYPKALRLQTGGTEPDGTAERGSPAAGSTWRRIRRRRAQRAWGRRARATFGRRRVVPWQCWPWASAGNRQHAPAAPLWGIRQGRFCAARGSAGAGGSANTVNMPPRGAVGVGDRQQRRCAAPWCRRPRQSGSVVGRVALPVKIDPHTPASRRRAGRGAAGPVTGKRLLARPGNTGGQDRLPAAGRRAAGQDRLPICRQPRGAAAPSCDAKMILLLTDKIKGGSAVDHSMRARADNAPT